ncbi:translocation/assembly module TamB domain-containing protein [Brackiella oedipodis]|uniref:translocation/assembly module TamB domain-containing protein n=1 Tax=Brackiella oedipodis TaxID=124225 RepID=UPI00048F2C75|nr:translocation/assembly module TamB domain-containing protein [Brackiella oedipodis]
MKFKAINWSFLKRKRTLLLIPILLLAFFAWVLATNSGSYWLLNTVMGQLGGNIGKLEGNIYKGVKLDSLNLNMPSINVAAHDVDLEINWGKLLGLTLEVERMHIDSLSLQLLPVNEQSEDTTEDEDPLSLPIDIHVKSARLNSFDLQNTEGGHLPVQLSRFDARDLVINDQGAQLDLHHLQVDNDDLQANLKGLVKLGQLGAPWPMDITLDTQVASDKASSPVCVNSLFSQSSSLMLAQCDLQLQTQVTGDLNDLKIRLNGSGQNASLKAALSLGLEQPLVLTGANIDFRAANHIHFLTDIHSQTDAQGEQTLAGEIVTQNLKLDRVLEDSALSSHIEFTTRANAQHLRGLQLKADIDKGSHWNQENLAGNIDLDLDLSQVYPAVSSAQSETVDKKQEHQDQKDQVQQQARLNNADWSKARLKQAAIDLQLGNNNLRANGQLGQAEDVLTLKANLPQLNNFWPTLSGHARTDINLKGGFAQHALDLKASYDSGKNSKDLGQAPLKLALHANGQAQNPKGRLAWRGQLHDLDVNHANLALQQEQALNIDYAAASATAPMQLAISPSQFSLSIDKQHKGLLQHQGTRLEKGHWQSQGNFENLVLTSDFMHQLGLPFKTEANRTNKASAKDVSYNGQWQFTQAPELNLRVNLQRTSGDSLLPIQNGIPLDLQNLDVTLQEQTLDFAHSLLQLQVQGQGPKSNVDIALELPPKFALGVNQGHIDLQFSDQSSLKANIAQDPHTGEAGWQVWQTQAQMQGLNLQTLSLGLLPSTHLNGDLNLQSHLLKGAEIKDLKFDYLVKEGSTWQGKAMSGQLASQVDLEGVLPLPSVIDSPLYQGHVNLQALRLHDTDIDLSIADNHIQGKGGWGQPQDHLNLQLDLPQLGQLWPDIKGQANVALDLSGNIAQHALKLKGKYDLFPASSKQQQALNLNLALAGKAQLDTTQTSWQGTLEQLAASYAGTALQLQSKNGLAIDFKQDALKHDIDWSLGDTQLRLQYPDKRQAFINLKQSQGHNQTIDSAGSIEGLVLSMPLYHYLQAMIESLSTAKIVAAPAKVAPSQELQLNSQWQLHKDKAITAELSLQRQGAQGNWPFDLPVVVDFSELALQVKPWGQRSQHGLAGQDITLKGKGPHSVLDGHVQFNPSNPMLVDLAKLDLKLPDNAMIDLDVISDTKVHHGAEKAADLLAKAEAKAQASQGTVAESETVNQTRDDTEGDESPQPRRLQSQRLARFANSYIKGHLKTHGFKLEKLSDGAVPPGQINGDINFEANMRQGQFDFANFSGNFGNDSRWNRQSLVGNFDIQIKQDAAMNQEFFKTPYFYVLQKSDINLRLGSNVIKSSGSFGHKADKFNLSVNAPQLSQFWPDIPGAVKANLDLVGSLSDYTFDLSSQFKQGNSQEIGKAPIDAHLKMQGGWGKIDGDIEGWHGSIDLVDVKHAGFSILQNQKTQIKLAPVGKGDQPQWDIGASKVRVGLPGNYYFDVVQDGTKGGEGKWDTKGKILGLKFPRNVVRELQKAFGGEAQKSDPDSGVVLKQTREVHIDPASFDINWDFAFNQQLKGAAAITYKHGDFAVPAPQPFPLGLKKADVKLSATPRGEHSDLSLDLNIDIGKRGQLQAHAVSLLNGLKPVLDDRTRAHVKGGIGDLAALSPFVKDVVQLGGRVDLDVDVRHKGKEWLPSGKVQARDLKIIEVENGIRLLNGTADVALNGNNIVIEKIYFPSVLRIRPVEWRTRTWIEKNKVAQQGSLNANGHWNLKEKSGEFHVNMDHYPVMQRSDRYAMMSGNTDVSIKLPHIDVKGKIVADAGWASIDIQGTAPSLDSDVEIVDKNQTEEPKASPMDLDLDFTVDLGPRFYIVGFGLDSGLRGAINVVQDDNRLTGIGEFNTRGGAIEAYGQRLQIRRGSVSFTGDLTNPVLNITAMRTGLEVNAGVRVQGSAKRPKISLVSEPEVSDVEKLSWLIMGRGPDSNGADLSLLFSVGSSIVGGGEPFYQKLGIDELAIRTGDIGNTGSILPKKTVADSTSYDDSQNVENQFLTIGKKLSTEIWANIEQALSGTGTVVRASYRFSPFYNADIKVGTVNGIEYLFRRFFKD